MGGTHKLCPTPPLALDERTSQKAMPSRLIRSLRFVLRPALLEKVTPPAPPPRARYKGTSQASYSQTTAQGRQPLPWRDQRVEVVGVQPPAQGRETEGLGLLSSEAPLLFQGLAHAPTSQHAASPYPLGVLTWVSAYLLLYVTRGPAQEIVWSSLPPFASAGRPTDRRSSLPCPPPLTDLSAASGLCLPACCESR